MLQLRLQSTTSADFRDLPGRSYVRLMGPSLRTPGNRELVRLEDKGWRVGQDMFDTLRCDSPVNVRFVSGHRRSDDFGPFDAVKIVGNEVHVKNGSEFVLAQFHDDQKGWQYGGDMWPLMVVVAQSAMDVEMD